MTTTQATNAVNGLILTPESDLDRRAVNALTFARCKQEGAFSDKLTGIAAIDDLGIRFARFGEDAVIDPFGFDGDGDAHDWAFVVAAFDEQTNTVSATITKWVTVGGREYRSFDIARERAEA